MKPLDDQQNELKFECTNCGQHISVPEVAIGGLIDCPGCNEKIGVPTREAATAEAAEAAATAEAVVPAAGTVVAAVVPTLMRLPLRC